MSAGYSGTPLARKLGIGPGDRLVTLHAPKHFGDLLGDLPDDVVVEADPPLPSGFDDPDARTRDVVVLFVPDEAALERRFEGAQRLLAWDGGLWVAWPKQSSPMASELKQGGVQKVGLGAGLVDNKVCAIDDDWSGLRFVYRREHRP